MFSSLKTRIVLGIFVFVMISIPIGAYLASQTTTFKSKAQEVKPSPSPQKSPKPAASPAKELLKLSEPAPESQTPATSFGPTLSLKIGFEGRPKDKHSGRLFIGIVEGIISLNPKFLLSFTLDLPSSGIYEGLSLAGLNPGTRYSALLKGTSQIASASAFIMSPTVTNLNNGQAITLLSGDLNEDNTINSQDYSIAQKALGLWNENADFNKDGVINTFDLAIITKNFGKIGDSGAWTSPLPKSATPSGGYWLWVPGL